MAAAAIETGDLPSIWFNFEIFIEIFKAIRLTVYGKSVDLVFYKKKTKKL